MEVAGFQALFEVLKSLGYLLVGPRVRDGAIVYDELASVDALPAGWTDEQEGGKYRLRKREDCALFGYAVGPHSWKKFLFPPVIRLWSTRRTSNAELARALNQLPPPLVSYGIEGKNFDSRVGLSPEVKMAAEEVFRMVKKELWRFLNRRKLREQRIGSKELQD